MKRFVGEEIRPDAKIAVIANDALGNYVVCTPLLTMLRNRYPDAILHFFNGSRTAEFWQRDSRLNAGVAIFGTPPSAIIPKLIAMYGSNPYDLVINLESTPWAMAVSAMVCGSDTYVVGPALGPEGRGDLPYGADERSRLWQDPDWMAADLMSRYPFLKSGFIGEIFCRLAYLDGEIPAYELPRAGVSQPLPDVLIATSASLPEKLWPTEKWESIIERLQNSGLTVGLLGAKPSAQAKFWQGSETEARLIDGGWAQDLRGHFSLPEVVGALAACNRILTLDNGILHLAAATRTPCIGLFRHGIHRLWAPPAPNITVITPGEGRLVAEISIEEISEALGVA